MDNACAAVDRQPEDKESEIVSRRPTWEVETILDDLIPDERHSRRRTGTTRFERILVMQKE
jgi:hypothetical protein